jgi:tetratricopeptide (TPR) repeat protein
MATGNVAIVLYSLGMYEAAREHYERQLALARETGARQVEAYAVGGLGYVSHSLGCFKEAREHYNRWLAIAREIGDRLGEAYATLHLGFAAEEGDSDSALTLYEDALAVFRGIDFPRGIAETLVALGRLHKASGRVGASTECLTEARSLGVQLGVPGTIVLAQCHLALLPDSDPTEALSTFEELEDRLDCDTKVRSRILLWKATHKPSHVQEAKRLLDHLVEHAPEEYRESMLRNVQVNREIGSAWKALHPERAAGESKGMEAWAEHGGEIEAEGNE